MTDETPIKAARIPAGPKVREWSRRHRFDDWMVARWTKMTDRPGRLLAGLQEKPPQYVRANPLRTDADGLFKRLTARGFDLEQTDLDPNIFRIHHAPMSPGATMEHMRGLSIPQDLASASAPIALGAGSAERVIDLAAAPGVKTLHIAGDMENQGALVAVDPDADRMRGLRFNLERCGVKNTLLRLEPGQDVPGEAWADRILLDAPCTGEGTIPKDRNRKRGKPDEITRLAAVQSELVDAADRLLRPGGTLVYATCTFAPEENEAQVQRLVDRGFVMEDLPFDSCGGERLLPGLIQWPGLTLSEDVAKARRFMPGIHPTLGFFLAKLRKPTEAP